MMISDAFAEPPVAAAAPTTAATGTAVTPAGASTAQDGPSPFSGIGVMLFFVAAMYFFMIRPNQKRIRDFETMVKALKRGDRVVTGGGIIGTISKIENDDVLVIEIAPEVKVRVMRDTISNVVGNTVANDNKAGDKSKKTDEKASV